MAGVSFKDTHMTQFMNKRENIVTEAIDGTLMASAGRLVRLDGYPHIRVVMRTDWDKSKVAIVWGRFGARTCACWLCGRGHADSGCLRGCFCIALG
jgi:hypothetical protein